MQGLLLRFLETGEIQKVGAERVVRATDVRVMCATNRNLRDLISQGQFREDLFYRINVIHIEVAPLRERREDIPLLIEYFLARFTGERSLAPGATNGAGHDNDHLVPDMDDLAETAHAYTASSLTGDNGNGIRSHHAAANGNGGGVWENGSTNGVNSHSPVRAISRMAMDALCEYSWPGNVRQVENVVERLVVTGRREIVQLEELPPEIRNPAGMGGRTGRERRRTVADELFKKLVDERESFWQVVYPLYMNREITRANVRDLVHKGLEEARGNYKIVLRLFNMDTSEYKRFLNFLRKHDCQLPFKEYR
jgi:DNA-binding NtrC family response regulator